MLKTDLQPQPRCNPDGAPDRPAAARQRADSDADGAAPRPFARVLADAPGATDAEGTGCAAGDSRPASAAIPVRGAAHVSECLLEEDEIIQLDTMQMFGSIELSAQAGFALAAASNMATDEPSAAAGPLGTGLPTAAPQALAAGTGLPLDGKILPPPGQLPVVETNAQAGTELLLDTDTEAEALALAANPDRSKPDIEIELTALDAPLERGAVTQPRSFSAYGHTLTQQAMPLDGDAALDAQLGGQFGNGTAGQSPTANPPMHDGVALGSQSSFHAPLSGTATPSQAGAEVAATRANAQLADPILTSQLPLTLAGGDAGADPLGERLIALATQGQHFAKLRLHPAELGALEVRIKLHDDVAAITISSQHAHVRDAIESTLPRLRELFAAQGMNLVDVDVSGGDRHTPHGGDSAGDSAHEHAPVAALHAEPVGMRGVVANVDRHSSRLGGHRIDLLA